VEALRAGEYSDMPVLDRLKALEALINAVSCNYPKSWHLGMREVPGWEPENSGAPEGSRRSHTSEPGRSWACAPYAAAPLGGWMVHSAGRVPRKRLLH
jgi:hypothetical protein